MLDGAACSLITYHRDLKLGMNHEGPPGSHVLPFADFAPVKSIVSRHVPKAGSSTMTRLLQTLWTAVVRTYNVDVAVNIPKVLNFDNPTVKRLQARNDTVELVVVREPLDRFASGYYFRRRNKYHSSLLHGLAEYARDLPDAETDLHLFPESWFLCNCHPRCKARACAAHEEEQACLKSLRYVLPLEQLAERWKDFVADVVLQDVDAVSRDKIIAHLGAATPVGNAGKYRPEINRQKDTFDAVMGVDGASSWHNITEPLCRYLAPDYVALRHYYPPLRVCQ